MTEPQHLQPVAALGQMLGGIAAMHREQAERSSRQLEAFNAQTEAQIQLLQSLLTRLGAGATSPPPSLELRHHAPQTGGGGRSADFSGDV